ncbi:MAG: RluA family pseudouridine synthase [Gammaproteobacteria bacterium]|nr:RluA family pseudouridine synthase [Gammaproteobacteria bacterium]
MSETTQQPPSRVRFAQISEDEAGQRIDNYLLRQFKGVPKSHIYRILRKGEVRVNKKRIKPTYKLVAGDEVRLPPVRTGEKKTRRPPDEVIERLESRIVYDDERLIVVNKPAGLAVHAGSGVEFGVIDVMQQIDKRAKELFLVHRLDRDTSGCLLIARDRQALRALQTALENNDVDKFYTALVMGHWGDQDSRVDMPLRRNKMHGGERLVQVDSDGKQAVSDFKVVREYAGKPAGIGCSLMKIQLITGRTHQIRVHGAESGHPLAGDRRYGDEEFNQQMRSFGLKRMFLHASALNFPHPDNGQTMHIEPPLDDELQQILDRLAA